MPQTHPTHDRAVVLGGSIAGLLAARVLSDHFNEVIVVERDQLDANHGPRRGTPQSRHVHALLASGHTVLEELFVGLTDDLVAQGAPRGDILADTRLAFGGRHFRPGPSGLTLVNVRRPTLEETVRRRVTALPNVRPLDGHDVVGLLCDQDARTVVGVRVISRDGGSAEEELAANLVVDATGRGSRLPAWLESLGLPRPPTDKVHVGVGYTSGEYRFPAGTLDGALISLTSPTPESPRGGVMTPVDDGRWLVTLIGVLGDHPPTDPQGFARFAADVVLPDIHEALPTAEPLTELVAHRHPTSVWHRYDRMDRLPGGIIALGDAVCALNPIYGQGMTVAALEAAALGRHLRAGPVDPQRYQREVGRLSGVAWALSTGGDLSFPDVEGRRTPVTRMLGRYVARLHAGAARDPALGAAFLRVAAMVDAPTALFRPSVVARAIRPRDTTTSPRAGRERMVRHAAS